LYEKFVKDTKSGRRLQPNGKRFSAGTLKNYDCTLNLLRQFSAAKQFSLRILPERSLTKREREAEKAYWKKFYRKFTDYLYDDLGHFDNYVGATIKNIKAFFNYLNREALVSTGQYHKLFYIRKEEIAIHPLLPEELNYLIYDKTFEQKLDSRLREAKDVFVFGCTVALRVSDLLALKRSALRIVNSQYYLAVRSKKTGTDTLVKLPPYAVAIVEKYQYLKKGMLPPFNSSNLNRYIKDLIREAGFTHPIELFRERRGKRIPLKKNGVRFCDVVSTHTMRRTAITTMLCLGMPEQVVRKISGHAPGGKEFYRYVLWAQTYQDQESEKVFEKLKERQLMVA
jgi:integrase